MRPRVSPRRASSAVPAMELRSASNPPSFDPLARAAYESPGCPASPLLQRLRVSDAPAVSRTAHLPAVPTVSSRVAPRARSLGCPRRAAPRVSSHSAPAGGAIASSADYPAGFPAACLTSCSHGWADVTPRLLANLASPAWPRMNLCFRPAPAHSRLALDAISIELQTPCRCRLEVRALSDWHRPASGELRFQFPGGHQLMRRLGWLNLWKQVQKRN
jgi:hypothetical protein